MDHRQFKKEPMWKPSQESGRKILLFMKRVEEKYNNKFDDYWDLHKWSVEHLSEFWAEFWDFCGVICSKRFDQVIDLDIPMEESPKWFEGARLNYAENILKYRDDHVAIVVTGEDRDVERITFRELYEEAKLYSAAFRNIGLKKGDRVACYMSNRKEAVIAMIAVTSIGGIWTGGLPLFGAQAYLSRVQQVKPKFLITVDQFSHNKEIKYLLQNIEEIVKGLPSLEKVIIVPSKPESIFKDISVIKNSCFLHEFLKKARRDDGSVPDIVFEQVEFSHPLFISYTSGTTGLPKTIIHDFGSLFPAIRDFWLHWDSQREDIWLTMSAVGWVSWNMAANMLFTGETICLFEGLPYFLSPTHLWDMVDELNLTRLFLTPTVLDNLEAKGYLPTDKHHLNSLKMIVTGGSVVKPHNFDFAIKKIKKDMMFTVGYGCSEVMGFCVVTEQTLPCFRGEISAPALGVAAECLDESGNSLTGEMGEFVISKPMPALTTGLWNDTNGKIYRKSYFTKYPGKFFVGDTAIINPLTKGFIFCGRSDETLKPEGCRFGSSEIYNVVETIQEVQTSICVAQYSKGMDERVVLFVKMKHGYTFNNEVLEKIRRKIEEELTVRHVPEVILEAPDVPQNVNGKKMEIIVKKIINKMPHSTETVANPECLNFYYSIPKTQGF